jgi:hypothetical protein
MQELHDLAGIFAILCNSSDLHNPGSMTGGAKSNRQATAAATPQFKLTDVPLNLADALTPRLRQL